MADRKVRLVVLAAYCCVFLTIVGNYAVGYYSNSIRHTESRYYRVC